MAQASSRGFSPSGSFGHGGHHRKDFKPHPMNKNDHMASAPEGSMAEERTEGASFEKKEDM